MSVLREALRDLPDAVFADLLESDDGYLLVALPGTSSKTVDVTVEDEQARIEARREKDQPPAFRYVREERSLFLDVELPLPTDAAETGVEATVERGVLELTVPKREGDPGAGVSIEIDGDGDGDDEE